MPQLEPFFFVSQLASGLFALVVLTEALGAYVFPLGTTLNISRLYITKL